MRHEEQHGREGSIFTLHTSWQTCGTCKKRGKKFIRSHHATKIWHGHEIILYLGLRKSTLEHVQYNIILLPPQMYSEGQRATRCWASEVDSWATQTITSATRAWQVHPFKPKVAGGCYRPTTCWPPYADDMLSFSRISEFRWHPQSHGREQMILCSY